MTTFADLGVPTPIADALAADGKTSPFPIQEHTLPDTLAGRDVLGRGKTGSGKTVAFSVPLVTRLAEAGVKRRPGRPTGLVLAPTRELATQIATQIEPLADVVGLRVTTVFGGVKQARQERALGAGADIVVACPGRLEDLMKQRIVSLDDVQITVLDEADHMADLGFLPVVTRLLAATPQGGMRMLFSATLDNGVDKLVKRFLNKPVTHSLEDATSPVAQMTHHVFRVGSTAEKTELVRELASGTGRRILFTRTKHQAKKLAKKLTADGIPAVDLHGNLSQAQRDRNLASFAAPDGAKVLVATDVAARGVHVDGVELVVHVDPPAEHKAYLHRSGRTARAGSSGDVVTICLPEQWGDLRKMLQKAAIKVPGQQVTAGSPEVAALVGERAPLRHLPTPAPAAQQRQGQPRTGQGRGSRGAGRGRRGGSGQPQGHGQRQGSGRGEQSSREHAPAARRTERTERTDSAAPRRRRSARRPAGAPSAH
ncbi:putative ATP-dependent RNA helicase [Gordonia spumicola]|uniref:Putative ATP-dependent RNA helicase n=1 Tax=Gordonia spumicola TaxID=589161 RepID=A0A7I9V592_9ACTN|nr:DEAD/DEAH box helicase [Gordonia spumicola]GEE00417.1 putative ATP-dependent RNA helicase [Gordonia spumicola]